MAADETPTQKLDRIGIDTICDMIASQDLSYRAIAKEIGVHHNTMMVWLQSNGHSMRARASQAEAARYNDDEGLRVLQGLPADATPGQIAQARELASYHKWRASKRNPKDYGDKIIQEHTGGDGEPLSLEVIYCAPAARMIAHKPADAYEVE